MSAAPRGEIRAKKGLSRHRWDFPDAGGYLPGGPRVITDVHTNSRESRESRTRRQEESWARGRWL